MIIGAARPEALETSYSRAFRELNWKVETWDAAGAASAAARGGHAGRLFSRFVQVEPWRRKANVELLQRVEELRPELVLAVALEGLRAGTLAQAKVLSRNTHFCMAYPDSPHSLDSDRLACMRICDRVGVSAPDWKEPVQRLSGREVAYLPFAADTHLYRALPQAQWPASPQWDVGFFGTWRAEREALLAHMTGFKTRIWGGPYWKSRTAPDSPARAMWAGHELIGDRFAAACADTAIMLNIIDPITWPGPNMRSFELPACGAFVLSTRSEAILEIFKEGETIECFDSPDEALDKVKHYLANPGARRRIAWAAHDYVLRGGHTYLDRARTIASWADS